MFSWISSLFASAALDAAIHSAGLASTGGMHQPKEPAGLQKLAEESKKSENVMKEWRKAIALQRILIVFFVGTSLTSVD